MNPVVIGNAELYLGDCHTLLYGNIDHTRINALVSDPPYGKNWDTDASRFSGGASKGSRKDAWGERITGDKRRFDASPFLQFPHVILWGANCYEVPPGTALIWVKRNSKAYGSFLSDAEYAYKKGGHGVYCYKDVSFNGAGANFVKHHPAEKPVGLMQWCVEKTKGLVCDPFMGSGSTGVACALLGRPFVGIEIEKKYFDIACERIRTAQAQMRLL